MLKVAIVTFSTWTEGGKPDTGRHHCLSAGLVSFFFPFSIQKEATPAVTWATPAWPETLTVCTAQCFK